MRPGIAKSSFFMPPAFNQVAPEPHAPILETPPQIFYRRPLAAPSALPPVKTIRAINHDSLHRMLNDMPLHNQGQSNACGTAALAMALAYFGIPADYRILDKAVRPTFPGNGGPSVPGGLVDSATRLGLQATQYNRSDFEQLYNHVTRALPAIVLLNFSAFPFIDDERTAHFVNVIGFDLDNHNKVKTVVIANPHGRFGRIPFDQFIDQWSHVSLTRQGCGSAIATYHHNMILLARPEDGPLPHSTLAGALTSLPSDFLGSGLSGATSCLQTIKRGFPLAGLLEFAGAITKTTIGSCAFILGNLIGKNTQRLGGHLTKQIQTHRAKRKSSQKRFALAIAAFKFIKFIGASFNGLGGLIAALGTLVTLPFSAIANQRIKRSELREMLVNPNRKGGLETPKTVLKRASIPTKHYFLKTLLKSIGRKTAADEKAALVVLESAKSVHELEQLAAPFGGLEKLFKQFSKKHRPSLRDTIQAHQTNEPNRAPQSLRS